MDSLKFKIQGYFGVRGFKFLEKYGLHVVPNHFYQPVPDTRKLPESTWATPTSMPGIDLNDTAQLKLLSGFCSDFRHEFEQIPSGGQFGSVDAEILYCLVRRFRPQRVLEIGSGMSTRVSAAALVTNGSGELVAVEPYPNEDIQKGFPGLTRLIASPVQEIALTEFEKLQENDILFIDSSHMLKIGSDVQFLFLEVLPRLKAGVLVHVHDIFLPANYPRRWVVDNLRFWNEQYILQAFLAFNSAFEVLWAGCHMHMQYPDSLEAAFTSYQRQQSSPGSFWMRKTC